MMAACLKLEINFLGLVGS